MDIMLSDEQRLLKESVERFIAGEYGFEQRKSWVEGGAGYSPENWATFAELGWLALPLPEDHGGLGGTLGDVAVLMEGFGRGLVVEPYLATVLLGAQIIADAGTDAQKVDILPRVAEGQMKLAFAHTERQSRYDLTDVKTEAKAGSGGFTLNGQKSIVFGAPDADLLVVSARTDGGQRSAEGLSLFCVAPDAAGLTVRAYGTQDDHRAADLTLENVEVDASALIGSAGEAFPTISKTVQRAMIALGAEAVGAMDVLNELTFEYLKTRKQFGAPIGAFQSLQHRAAEMLMAHKLSRAMVFRMAKASADDEALAQAASATKVQIGQAGKFVGQQAIQLHGGIGMTHEYAAGHYFKRLTMIDALFGTTDHHLSSYATSSFISS
ncbi:MAG: pimeloyl-CoA dehydrogenase small subunit [Alphaproteobacteria bacterium]|nr:pimeloyl-CoA dehydrogenase small subunit [Alphaproteobacteria bacterium]